MAKVNYIQTNFTGGELSPRLDGRVDVTKFKNGLRVCENFIVLPHGGARKRSGTRFVVELKSSEEEVVLVPFQYNVEQSYMLLFGPGYIWFLKDKGIITHPAKGITGISRTSPGVVTCPGHGLTNGQRVLLTSVLGMTQVNNRHFVVANATTDTFELSGVDTSNYSTYLGGGLAGQIVELATTYASDQLANLSFAQSADVLFVSHQNHPLRKITRTSHTAWTLTEPTFTTGPFRQVNPDRGNKLSVSNPSASATGYGTLVVGTSVTLTAQKANTFTSAMVGSLLRLSEEGDATGIISAPVGDTTTAITAGQSYTNEGKVYGVYAVSGASNWGSFTRVPAHDAGTVRVRGKDDYYFDADFLHPTYCVVRITQYNSSSQVLAQIVRYQMPRTIVGLGTSFWEEGAWNNYRGYPRTLAFYEQRLFLAGSPSDPSVLWGSRSSAYEDFEDGPDDDDALVYRITSGLADTIRWLHSGRVLTAGSSNGEYAIAASTQNEALTPSNFKAAPQTNFGTSDCPPIRIGQAVLYPQRNGDPRNDAKKLREFAYSFEQDSFNSIDMTVFSEHIMGPGIRRLAYQTEPDSLIWAARADGVLAACTYERTQEVIAWHRHTIGGDNVRVTTHGVIPGNNGDELWLSVYRYVGDQDEIGNLATEDDDTLTTEDGDTLVLEETEAVRYIEVMEYPFTDTGEKEDAFMVDSGLTYAGAETNRITGLWHLRGLDVVVNSNGSVERGTVSENGELTLARKTRKAHVGIPYTATLETQDFEAGAQAGTAQGRQKRISEIGMRVLNSLGGRYGPDANTMRPIFYRTGSDRHGSSPPLYSGIIDLDFDGNWENVARVRVEHDEPLPFHVTGITAALNVSG